MTDRLPPHSIEAEQAVIGSLLLDRDAIVSVAEMIPDPNGTFYDRRHAVIFRAVKRLFQDATPCDMTILVEFLTRHDALDKAGGRLYLEELRLACQSPYHVVYYAEQVLKLAKARAVIEAAGAIVKDAYAVTDDIDIEACVTQLREKAQPFVPVGDAEQAFADTMAQTRATLEARFSGRLRETIVPTGIRDLDRITNGGIRGGELFILAGRPGMGKSSLALQILSAQPGVYVSLEMKRLVVAQRLTAMYAEVPYGALVARVADQSHRDEALAATRVLERTSKIVAIRDDLYTVNAIDAFMARAIAEQGARSLVIDHMGLLMDGSSRLSEYEQMSRISGALKKMAMRFDIPVIALCQLNRAVENRPECLPYLSDLRASGHIEQDGDTIGLLYRRAYYVGKNMVTPDNAKDMTPDGFERVLFNIAKNRNGEEGFVELGWNGPSMRFHHLNREAA